MKSLKPYLLFFALILMQCVVLSQRANNPGQEIVQKIDSLKHELASAKVDSIKLKLNQMIGFNYESFNVDSALRYDSAYLLLAQGNRDKDPVEYSRALASISSAFVIKGKFADAMEALFKALAIAKENNNAWNTARAYRRLSFLYFEMENYSRAVHFGILALQIDSNIHERSAAIDRLYLANAYEKINNADSAIFYAEKALQQKDQLFDGYQTIYLILGDVSSKKNEAVKAMSFYKLALEGCAANKDVKTASDVNAGVARLLIKSNQGDSAKQYALAAFNNATETSYKRGIINAAGILAKLYDTDQPATALAYYKILTNVKDSLFGTANIETIQNLVEREENRQRETAAAALAYQNRIKWFGTVAGLATLLIIAFILYRSNRRTRKANLLLNEQKLQVENTLTELKATQKQLIQSEKMASLGELTAGIAHEIQNPLNFVNNFSEVSNELIDEILEEKNKEQGTRNDELEIDILNDIKQNLEKINHHGKRADAIVKGMLQHSRSSSGQKELTDINALCDEYLRLSYHGLRAKDKSFNATLRTEFDESIGKINVIPQDIGRVIMNLLTNAFYAVNEKVKLTAQDSQLIAFEPTVSISTKKINNKIEITVSDNGNGIPDSIKEKIFQPFFTTKPTGQGTGLGLSLSYDIITKGHGGELKMETKKGEGCKFSIQLPITGS